MAGKPTTVEGYLAGQSPEKQEALAAVRRVILENLPEGYVADHAVLHDQLRNTPGGFPQNL